MKTSIYGMTESQIENQILEWLNTAGGVFAWKNNSTGYHDGKGWRRQSSPFAINGVADIICIDSKGTVRFLEVKTAKGIQSPAQINFQAKLGRFKGIYHLIRSLDDAKKIFQ